MKKPAAADANEGKQKQAHERPVGQELVVEPSSK